jgi:hypothetical protein
MRSDDSPRWNTWTRVQPVQFDHEQAPQPRDVRLACAAARVGDPVQVTDGGRCVHGRIAAVAHSILHVRRGPAVSCAACSS